MKKIIALILVLAIAISLVPCALAYDTAKTEKAAKAASEAIKSDDPSLGSEWFMVADSTWSYCGLSSSYRRTYYNNILSILKENDGGLGVNRFTDYERVMIALTALGYDVSNVGGYNMLIRLADYDVVKKQGINSIIFGLIALDSGCYDMPTDPNASTQNSRKKMVDNILSRELAGGGFALRGDVADVDITAMAIQALSKYTYRDDVKKAIDRAVAELARQQLADGSFASLSGKSNEGTAESTAQVILALTTVGVSVDDSRFKKNVSLMDALLSFQLSDGSFKHLAGDTESDYSSTVQALHAMSAVARAEKNGIGAYAFAIPENTRFTDVVYNDYRAEIEALAAAEIINGMTDTTFAPDATMTRAQFATIVVKTLGLELKTVNNFKDVASKSWYAGYVGAAYSAGIIQGRSDTMFDPEGTITDVEAHIMLARAAKLVKVDQPEPEWYKSDYNITRAEVAAAVYELYSRMK